MLLLMLPLVEGPERGWAGWPIAMLVASPIAFVGFYLHQRRKSRRGLSPLLETDLFGDRAFNVGALLILIFWGSTTPFSFSYVLLIQTGYGYSPLATAASLAILGGAFGIVSPIASRLASFGVRRIMMAGVLVDLAGMLLADGVGGMSEKSNKVQPKVNVLAAFASTIVGAFAVGLPMAVAIIWVCS